MLAPEAKRVIGVEIIEEAVEAARENAARNGLSNCEFLAGDVLKVLDTIEEKPDLWKKFWPHPTFVQLLKAMVDVLERKQKLSMQNFPRTGTANMTTEAISVSDTEDRMKSAHHSVLLMISIPKKMAA